MENNHYIYFHINLLKNEVFYVGQGINKRAYSKYGRNKHWHNLVKKYGYKTEIIEKNLNQEEANNREIFFINKFGRKDLGLGPLVNKTNGGDVENGRVFTKEHKLKLSIKAKKRLPMSQEIRDKISIGGLGRIPPNKGKKGLQVAWNKGIKGKDSHVYGEKHPMFGKKHSEESKNKMRKPKTKTKTNKL